MTTGARVGETTCRLYQEKNDVASLDALMGKNSECQWFRNDASKSDKAGKGCEPFQPHSTLVIHGKGSDLFESTPE